MQTLCEHCCNIVIFFKLNTLKNFFMSPKDIICLIMHNFLS